ncbi:NAD(P)H-hydrate dehydratase [Ignavibacteria bacterium]|nr:NAD(P)H-hydrate dehydratase [Bacteroidota bacterium]MCZ2131608.1 NAD(P)H-hydrate dehydratase [Bacteroidota bacterium]
MKYILTPEEMRATDRAAVEELGIPSLILMENASRSAADCIRKFIEQKIGHFQGKIRIFCGTGNNGGDGLAIARHLYENYNLEVILAKEKKELSPECAVNFRIVSSWGIEHKILELYEDIADVELSAGDIIVDALLGIGAVGAIRGITVELLRKIKQTKTAAVIAIDNPSGLNCFSGEYDTSALPADLTITMAAEKVGLLLQNAPELCGNTETAFIGAPQFLIARFASAARWERGDSPLPPRQRISSKFDYGRVVIIAGSRSMPGAAALAANAAMQAGAGLVELFAPELHSALLPEIICREVYASKAGYFTSDDIEAIISSLEKADSVVIGPGLGTHAETLEFVGKIAALATDKPLIIDADALSAINRINLLPSMILTPHTGEFSRMNGLSRNDIAAAPFVCAREFASKTGALLHLKHIPSITTDGKFSYLTTGGNPGMATAGSGDVLSGIIGAFAARGIEPLQAASFGAFIHSEAGDLCARHFGVESVTASRITEMLSNVLTLKK